MQPAGSYQAAKAAINRHCRAPHPPHSQGCPRQCVSSFPLKGPALALCAAFSTRTARTAASCVVPISQQRVAHLVAPNRHYSHKHPALARAHLNPAHRLLCGGAPLVVARSSPPGLSPAAMPSGAGSLDVLYPPSREDSLHGGSPHSLHNLAHASSRTLSSVVEHLIEQQQSASELQDAFQQAERRSISGHDSRLRQVLPWQLQATGKLAAAVVLQELGVERVPYGGVKGMTQKACEEIVEHGLDDTFYIIDLANVLRLYKAWRAAMPRVMPFYAVKCNPEPGMLRLLSALGAGFDCASMGEVDMMLKLGVHPSRIIFAHPCKRPVDIRYAKDHGIEYTTFDTLSELHKVASMHPGFKLVLRIRADDPDARVPLGLKYGADVADAPLLLRTAKQLGLNVVGVSFHVGSACKNLCVFSEAIGNARKIFDQATALGFEMELLDIGGGFTGHFDAHGHVMFGEIAHAINTALAQYFPTDMGVRVIAEPGRYFAETMATLLTPVYGQRDRIAADGEVKKDYWITDGLYGSFNCIIYDGQNPEYTIVRSPLLPEPAPTTTYKSTLWGPTCDSADCVYKDHVLPELRNGDWLLFPNAGAYTVAGACDFNGIEFTRPRTVYVFSDAAMDPPAGYEGGEVAADMEQDDQAALLL